MEPPFARCIAVCALMCLVVSVSHAAAATTQTQASTTPNASPKASSASTQSSMTTTQTQASTTPSASPKSSSASTQSPMSAVSTATTNNLTTITSTFSPTDSTASTNNQTTGSMLSSPAGSTIAPNDQTSGPTSSSHNGSTPGSTTSGPSTGPTSSVCEQPTDFICQSFTDGANALLLCRWEEKPRNTCHGYKVHCAANTTSLGQPQSFTKTTKHIILFQNVRNDINYICTLNSSNRPNLTILVTRNIPDSHQPHPGLSSGQIVTIVLLLVIVVVCLIFLRKFYLKIRKLERQYNNDEGVCLLPKGIRGFQKETIVKESAPIPAKVLRQTVQTKTASGSKLFQEEFSNFPRKINKYSQQEATQEYNTKKNRYSDILPYDHNRVKLSGEGESDYINASYVDGYKSSIRYIAAQGPLENTAGDFWQMIWEKKSSVIVMVTKCEEMGKVKCFQYWPHPDEDKRAYGDVTVTIVDEKPYADIVIRTLSISHSKHKGFGAHWVTHVQLVSWPDHGVPEDPNLLLKLRRRVNSFNGAGCTAVVVHCSAGVGRSGTYIGLDCLVRQLENEGHVDVYGCVFRLRHQRPLMVQVESQYVLLHRALLEHHLFGNTELSMAKLHSRVQAMKFKASQQDQSPVDVEFKRLPTFEGTFAQKAGRNSNNVSKNRSTNVIPYDFNRVKLWKFTPSEINDEEDDDDNNSDEDESDNENSDKDYINASFMDGYHKQKSIIATQNPLPDTVSDFWLMVVQQNCSHIVMLSELSEGGKEQSAHYWPLKGTQNYGAVGVTVRNVTSRRDLVVREFSLTYENTCAAIRVLAAPHNDVPKIQIKSLQELCQKKESVVTQIQYPHWKPDGLPKSPKALVAIMNAVQGCQKENGNNRHIVVHCSDGASRTGIFCALWNTLEAARVEGMVDFFQAVKWLNMQRPAIVQEKVHYRFLYETVCSFVNSTNGIQNAYKVALENVGSMHSVDIISEL